MGKSTIGKEDERVSISSPASGANYIADFMCKELKLIIEVDGYSHNFERQWYKDKSRQKELEEYGFTVLRFWDEEVFSDIESVSRVIEQWIDGYRWD